MRFIREHFAAIIILIVVVGLFLGFIWYPYQHSSAKNYLSAANTCVGSVLGNLGIASRNLSCTQGAVITVHPFLLGIGASYSFTARAACASGEDKYTGNIITIFNKRFVILAQKHPIGSQPNQYIAAC
jgi:hypothetical protein